VPHRADPATVREEIASSLRRGAAEVRKKPRPLVLGGLAKASGRDDGSIVCRGAIVKGKALGDATRPASFLGAERSNP